MNKITIFITYFENDFAISRLIHILAQYRTACTDMVLKTYQGTELKTQCLKKEK